MTVDSLNEGEVECILCGLIFVGFDQLNVHYPTCNLNGPIRSIKCIVCGKQFDSKYCMSKHYNNHPEIKKKKAKKTRVV